MAVRTPLKGRWVDDGSGVEVLHVSETSHRSNAHGELIQFSTYSKHVPGSTPSRLPTRSATGLFTPPNSGRKQVSQVSASMPKRSHTGFDYKLKVPDSKGRRLPRIVFRWWNPDSQGLNSASQLRAGLYENVKSNIPSPYQGPKLKEALLGHLTPEKRLSPFISTFENFLPALHRALKSTKDAFISVIDLQKVEKSSLSRFPEATEVIWPIKMVIKQYGFKLKNNYKGHEWLIHGIIEKDAIIRTIKVSDLQHFARIGRIRHMRDVLGYISRQQHAFGLVDNLQLKQAKTSYRTGQLVGKVLDHVKIPDEYKALVARKIQRMMRFKYAESHALGPRGRSYLKGVYNFDSPESDSDSDGIDGFVVSSNDGYDSDATFYDNSDLDDLSQANRSKVGAEVDTSTDKSDTSSSSSNGEDEQALLEEQLRATQREWLEATPSPTTLRMSHIQVPKLTTEQLGEFKSIQAGAPAPTIDLTNNSDVELEEADDEVIEVAPGAPEEDVIVVASGIRVNMTVTLTIRSTSVRSTVGPRGLARLEADAEAEVMEIMQFD